MSAQAKKEEKMNFRIDTRSKKLIEEGARLSGLGNSSAFMIQASVRQAEEVILRAQQVEKIRLSNQDFDHMMEQVEKPKGPTAKAKMAMKKFKKAGL